MVIVNIVFVGCKMVFSMSNNECRAAEEFREWLLWLDPREVVVYSDGSMMAQQIAAPAHAEDPDAEEDAPVGECVSFGYIIFQDGREAGRGYGQLEQAQVFDAEAEGACYGLKVAVALVQDSHLKITIYLNNTCDSWHHLGCHMPALKAPIHMGAVQSGHPIHGFGCHWLSPVVCV